MTEKRRRYPLSSVNETGKELFLGTCDSRGVGGVGILVTPSMAKNIDSFEQLTTRIGRLRMRRCGPTPALTIFVAYAPTSSYENEGIKAFYMDLEKLYRDHAFYKAIIGDFNAKIGPRRKPEELHIGTHGLQWNDQGERLSEFIMTTKTIHGNSQFQKPPGGGYRNEHLHDSAKKAESFKTTNRRLSLETLELIRQRGAARAAGNQELRARKALHRGDKGRP
ncbi:hypothetical protein RB195_019113 [Necator americanus]|uniref:Endonuclease/exonuclease/phosphatase family protein n=1 Tax=Necator americanus TaxID=51031 RepID=A0ABR1CCP4_NECAM